MFHVAGEDDIKKGRLTDIYFKRTEEILKSAGRNPFVRAEIVAKGFPCGYGWGIFAGLEEALKLLSGIDSLSVACIPEGTFFRENEPVITLEGKYLDFGVFETSLLGLICQASGIATKSARCKIAAGSRAVYSFGARRVHPAIAPMADRNAFIGGADGVSTTLGARLIGCEPIGTMPHSLILIIGDTLEAVKAFDRAIDTGVKRIALIDTFSDEKFEALKVAEGLGSSLYGVRLDTPSSRKGSFQKILEEVRWELDIRGFKEIKLIASGGLTEDSILELRDIADAFGIGTYISGAEVLDFSLDIVEIEGEKIAKKGKFSGAKKVLRCSACGSDLVILQHEVESGYKCRKCGGSLENICIPAIKSGKIICSLPPAAKIREYVMQQYKYLEL